MYFAGEGVEKSFVEARKYYKKAADKEYADAQYKLGVMIIKGHQGGDKYLIEGLTLINKAAKQDYEDAITYIDKMNKYLMKLKLA